MLVYYERLVCAVVAALAVAAAASVGEAAKVYTADLQPLNDSGVSGDARLTLDGDLLTVEINANGLEPNRVHRQHIHGRFSGGDTGSPVDSVVPTAANDTDGDGFVEAAESEAAVGPIILPLTVSRDGDNGNGNGNGDNGDNGDNGLDNGDNGLGIPPVQQPTPPIGPVQPINGDNGNGNGDNGNGDNGNGGNGLVYPTADSNGNLRFVETYDLSDEGLLFNPETGTQYSSDDLMPLTLRAIELHGLTVPAGVGDGTPGEVNGTGGYKPTLPVAAGEIVPTPAAVWAGLGLMGGLLLRRRRPTA